MANAAVAELTSAIRRSPTIRLVAVGGLTLLLQIPILMISALVSERQNRRDAAVEEVSSKWGLTQKIAGPALVMPYVHRWTEVSPKGESVARTETRHAVFLPARLRAVGTVDSDVRHRGIFPVPIYTLKLVVDGEFRRPGFAELGVEAGAVLWNRAQLAVGISDVRAINEPTAVRVNDTSVPFLPGTGGFTDSPAGVHAVFEADGTASLIKFSFPLTLNGSVGLYFAPFAESTDVELTSDSPHPNFQGNWLPIDRAVSDTGFRARWTIPSLGRNYPQAWLRSIDMSKSIDQSLFGVELLDPVDEHRMASRSVKYAGLFILLTFAAVWLIEVMAGVRVHPIQYLLLGAALCLFYLLELSLSEHLSFPLAYTLASAGVVGLVAGYSLAVLGRALRAVLVGAGVAGLYGYLFVLLTNEDSALLVGSVGLFVILAAIMLLTRRIDWYRLGDRSAPTRTQSG